MKVDRETIRSWLFALFWTICGAITMASFFFMSFFPEYSPFAEGEIGFSVIFAPLAVSFMVGLLANELDVPVMVLLAVILVLVSVVIAFLAVYSPLFSGVVADATQLPSSDEQRISMVFTTLFIVPLTVIGTVLGKAVGGMILPSDETLAERRLLVQRTREWHESLTRREDEEESEPEE